MADWLGLIFCLGLVGLMTYLWQRAMMAKSWPRTTGKIIHATVGKNQQRNPDLFTLSILFYPDIRYEYTVEGVKYLSDRYAMLPKTSPKEIVVANLVNRYSAGQSVIVYFNPQEPAVSVIETEVEVMWLIVGLSLSIGVAFVALTNLL
jgi:Protein of unknown function (DUF3592)